VGKVVGIVDEAVGVVKGRAGEPRKRSGVGCNGFADDDVDGAHDRQP